MKKVDCFLWVILICNVSFAQEKIELPSSENKIEDVVFKSYPNPVDDQLFILGTYKIKSVEFLDVSGKQAAFYTFNKSIIKINVSDLKKGIYILKVIDEKDKMQIKRLVKK